MIAVKLHILTRKTLGGIETDLDARVLKADGTPLTVRTRPARWAASAVVACTATGRWRAFPGWLHFLRSGGGPRRRLGYHLTRGARAGR